MKRRRIEHFHFLIMTITLSISFFYNGNAAYVAKPYKQSSFTKDFFIPPDILRHNSSITPGYSETSEYFIGSVAVGIIFLESDGTIDISTEDWTLAEEKAVVSEIQIALDWWSNQNPSAAVSFTTAINYSVSTRYEPISRRGGPPWVSGEEDLWIQDAMNYLGYTGTDYFVQVRDYVNALRNSTGTDWAFVMFIVDSSNDLDGKFADGFYFAYAYLGGPFLVMTYDNDGWLIGNMDKVTAHEMGHIFYATDEYDGETQYSGYLNVSDVDGSGALMDTADWWLSTGTIGQIGWRDTDSDGILDIVDTFPDTRLVLHPPSQTDNSTPTYAGFVTEVPYPNSNPYGTGRNVTINTIAKVEYNIDYSDWVEASPIDGAFDEAVENFTFTTPPLSAGTHIVEVRGINSVGNLEITYATHTVTVEDKTPPVTTLYFSYPKYITAATTYVSKNTTFTLKAYDASSSVANTYYRVDSESWREYTVPFVLSYLNDATFTIYFYSTDTLGNNESIRSSTITMDNTEPHAWFLFPHNESALGSTTIEVTWNGFDYGSGIDYYKIKINGKEYNNKGTSTSHTFSNITEGTNTISLKAVDKLGNSLESSVTFVVDKTVPIISVFSPQNRSTLRSSSIRVIWYTFDELSDVDYSEIRLDESLWINVTTSTTYIFDQVKDGIHIVDIKVTDKAGNYKQAHIVFSVNTSLIGVPGWTDDIIFLGAIIVFGAIMLVFLLKKQKKRQSAR